jgi:hypothetical protein
MAASMIWILAVAAVAMLPATTNALNNGGVARLPGTFVEVDQAH